MSKVRSFALGGLDEDGKNMFIVANEKGLCYTLFIKI